MKVLKIGVGILCLISFVLLGNGFYKDSKEQKALAKKAESINKQAAKERLKEDARITAIKETLPQIACWVIV
jgi:hypothetical protein